MSIVPRTIREGTRGHNRIQKEHFVHGTGEVIRKGFLEKKEKYDQRVEMRKISSKLLGKQGISRKQEQSVQMSCGRGKCPRE